MTARLLELIEKARLVEMTPQDIEEQRLSFAFGNTNYEDKRITMEDVRLASWALSGGHEPQRRSAR